MVPPIEIIRQAISGAHPRRRVHIHSGINIAAETRSNSSMDWLPMRPPRQHIWLKLDLQAEIVVPASDLVDFKPAILDPSAGDSLCDGGDMFNSHMTVR